MRAVSSPVVLDWDLWNPRDVALRLLTLGTLGLFVAVVFSGCPRSTGDPLLPTVTTDDPEAEAELRAATQREDAGDLPGAAARFEAFIENRPADPLRPVARLHLGKILLAEGDAAAASEQFTLVAEHEDASVRERGRFYLAVAQHLMGQSALAVEGLRPLVGRTVDPDETALLYRTLGSAAESLGDRVLAVRSYDSLAAAAVPDEDRTDAQSRIASLVPAATAEEVAQLYDALPRDGIAWPIVAPRALREAFARGELARVQAVGTAMTDAGIEIGPELRSMVLRAERTGTVDARAVGLVLPLSGRGREVGQLALQAVMLAAGLPPRGPPGPQTPRIFFRDSGSDPTRAAQAVDDLVTLHQVTAIIGPVEGSAARAAATRAQELGVPLLTLSPDASIVEVGDSIFRFFPSPEDEATRLVSAARSRGATRFVVLRPEHGYGETMASAFRAAVAAAGGADAGEVTYPAGTTSFGEVMQRLVRMSFDAVFIPDTGRQLALIAPAMAASGLRSTAGGASAGTGRAIQILAPSVGLDSGLMRSSSRYLQGALFSTPFHPESATGAGRAFADEFAARYGRAPDAFAATAHDAYRAIRTATAAHRRGDTVQRAAVRGALATSGAQETVSGLGGIGPGRQPVAGTLVLQAVGTDVVPLVGGTRQPSTLQHGQPSTLQPSPSSTRQPSTR